MHYGVFSRHHFSKLVPYLCLPLACVLPTANDRANFFRLSVFSLIVTTFFLFVAKMAFPGGAHLFLMYADQILHGGMLDMNVSQRDAGYPLLMVLTGVPQMSTFLFLMLAQALFAFLMPLFIYKMLAPFGVRVAYWAGIFSIVSLAPYQFMKWVHHDQPYIFFGLWGLYLFSRFITTGSRRYFVWLGIVTMCMSLTRPAGNWIYLILFTLSLFAYPRMWRFFLLNMAAFVLVLWLYQVHRVHAFGVNEKGELPSYTGAQIFYNLMVKSDDFGVTLSPDIGPNMEKLYNLTLESLKPTPEKSKLLSGMLTVMKPVYGKEFYRDNFTGMTSEQLARRMFTKPNYEYYAYVSGVVGMNEDRLYLNASKEIALAYPMFIVKHILRSTAHMLYNPGYADTRGNDNGMTAEGVFLLPFGWAVGNETSIPPRGLRELQYQADLGVFSFFQPLENHMSAYFSSHYRKYVRLTFPFAAFAFACAAYYILRVRILRMRPPAHLSVALDDKLSLIIIGIAGSHLYNSVVTAAFAEPSIRYHFFVLPMHTTLAAIGAYILWMLGRQALANWGLLRRASLPIPSLDRYFGRRSFYGYILLAGVLLAGAWLVHIQTALTVVKQ